MARTGQLFIEGMTVPKCSIHGKRPKKQEINNKKYRQRPLLLENEKFCRMILTSLAEEMS